MWLLHSSILVVRVDVELHSPGSVITSVDSLRRVTFVGLGVGVRRVRPHVVQQHVQNAVPRLQDNVATIGEHAIVEHIEGDARVRAWAEEKQPCITDRELDPLGVPHHEGVVVDGKEGAKDVPNREAGRYLQLACGFDAGKDGLVLFHQLLHAVCRRPKGSVRDVRVGAVRCLEHGHADRDPSSQNADDRARPVVILQRDRLDVHGVHLIVRARVQRDDLGEGERLLAHAALQERHDDFGVAGAGKEAPTRHLFRAVPNVHVVGELVLRRVPHATNGLNDARERPRPNGGLRKVREEPKVDGLAFPLEDVEAAGG